LALLFEMIALCGLALIGTSYQQTGRAPEQGSPTPERVLARLKQVYGSSKSYKDKATITITFHNPKGDRVENRAFSTEFIRPDRFRFDTGSTLSDHFVIWWNGKRIRSWWSIIGKVEQHNALSEPIEAATALAHTGAHAVPTMLLPERFSSRTFDSLRKIAFVGRDTIKGRKCFKISGHFGDSEITLWIDTNSNLLRRIHEKDSLRGIMVDEVIEYDPQLNTSIPPARFEFKPVPNK
jgi:outer membrane lipoprotein-sorting protein